MKTTKATGDELTFHLRPAAESTEVWMRGEAGCRLVVWNDQKWEYLRGAAPGWRTYVEVVNDLSAFFGEPIRGAFSL